MLLVCPSCRTRYVVPDTAISLDGRQVRCANCKHSWFQEGVIPAARPAPQLVAPPKSASVAAVPVEEVSFGHRQAPADSLEKPDYNSSDQPIPPSFERSDVAGLEHAEPVAAYTDSSSVSNSRFDEVSQQSHFAHEPPFRPRRNPAKIWTLAAVVFALTTASIGGALWYYGMPNIGVNLGVAGAEPDLKIILNENLELNEREDGTPFFIANGSIVNPTSRAQTVPEMLVTLKDAGGRPVYSWKMRAKVRSLAPGSKIDFSEARLDVPQAAAQISVGWVL